MLLAESFSWPDAVVVCVGAICATIAFCKSM